MKMKALLLIWLIGVLASQMIAQTEISKIKEESYTGSWVIDLRPSPDADAYYQYFVIQELNDSNLKGTFYGSEIKSPCLNREWGKLYFAFTTSDDNNEYYHSGYFEADKVIGMTYCPNRHFALPWTGVKK